MIPSQPESAIHAAAQVLPYGSWPSPLSAQQVASAGVRLGGLVLSGDRLLWTEGRPAEGGRTALCSRVLDAAIGGGMAPVIGTTLLDPPWNVRNRVHEYGGGSVASDGVRIWFCHDADRAIHQWTPDATGAGGQIERLHGSEGCSYADLSWCGHSRQLLAVCQDEGLGGQEPWNRLIAIAVEGAARGRAVTLASGHDFFSNPTPSPDGSWLAWLSWDHPNMPWDGTTLWCAAWHDGVTHAPRVIAGGTQESVFQPAWSPAGDLHFVSDRSGWWNLYCCAVPGQGAAEVHALSPLDAEFGMAQWEFGMRTYGFLADGTLIAIARQDGLARLGRIPAGGGRFEPFSMPWNDLRALQVQGRLICCIAGSPTRGECLLQVEPEQGAWQVLGTDQPTIADALVSVAEPVRFPGSGDMTSHAFFYAPHLPGVEAPAGTQPPLIVINHGGPTSATSATLRLAVQFWTTRGFAVLDVNYGGSTGYGRAYQQRLRGQWGIVDVEDAVAGAQWLAQAGRVDGARMAIRGSSAGGFTTLAALAFHRVFRAGVSLYGIGDLSLLAQDTHKFESRYLDSLVAPWPAGAEIYAARSPLKHIERFEGALLLLQGAEDRVVPPNQAEAMYQAVRQKGVPVAYLLFPGEQHGFRRQETVIRALQAELTFYGKIFGFTPADAPDPLPIANLA